MKNINPNVVMFILFVVPTGLAMWALLGALCYKAVINII